jgi:hypothetical protein
MVLLRVAAAIRLLRPAVAVAAVTVALRQAAGLPVVASGAGDSAAAAVDRASVLRVASLLPAVR